MKQAQRPNIHLILIESLARYCCPVLVLALLVNARYQWSDLFVLRTGMSFDQSPLTSAEYRTPRGPDADRTIFGMGASYQWKSNMDLDFSYGLILISKADVNSRENPAGTQHRAEGKSKGMLNNFGMQFNYRF